MSFNVSVFRCFCVISFFLVFCCVKSDGGRVVDANTTVSSTLSPHSHRPTTNNQTEANSVPGNDVSDISWENHPSGRHLSTPKDGSNATKSGNATNSQVPHVANPLVPPASSTVSPHHVSVEVNKPQADNIILDMTQSAAHHNMRTGKWNPTFAAVVAAICITTAVGGYIMLMAWRKMEMDRYGNRQMLINEDDFGDIQDEDMRHFEMQELRSVKITIPPSHRKTLSS